jgi:hypothetical protein
MRELSTWELTKVAGGSEPDFDGGVTVLGRRPDGTWNSPPGITPPPPPGSVAETGGGGVDAPWWDPEEGVDSYADQVMEGATNVYDLGEIVVDGKTARVSTGNYQFSPGGDHWTVYFIDTHYLDVGRGNWDRLVRVNQSGAWQEYRPGVFGDSDGWSPLDRITIKTPG